jgi:hypothetical protein
LLRWLSQSGVDPWQSRSSECPATGSILFLLQFVDLMEALGESMRRSLAVVAFIALSTGTLAQTPVPESPIYGFTAAGAASGLSNRSSIRS